MKKNLKIKKIIKINYFKQKKIKIKKIKETKFISIALEYKKKNNINNYNFIIKRFNTKNIKIISNINKKDKIVLNFNFFNPNLNIIHI